MDTQEYDSLSDFEKIDFCNIPVKVVNRPKATKPVVTTTGQKKMPRVTDTFNQTSTSVGNYSENSELVSKSLVCDKCNSVFENMQVFINHACECLPSIEVQCIDDSCFYSFPNQTVMLEHFNEVHERKNEPFQCAHCDKAYSTARTLRHHVQNTHSPDEQHTCEICGENFTTDGDLSMHQTQHAGIKPFGCMLCNAAAFSTTDSLAQHVHLCGTTSLVTCPCCKKTFRSQPYYQEHIVQAHTINQTYDCDQCTKTYK